MAGERVLLKQVMYFIPFIKKGPGTRDGLSFEEIIFAAMRCAIPQNCRKGFSHCEEKDTRHAGYFLFMFD